MSMQEIMLIAGVFLLSLALRTMNGIVVRKLSLLGFLTTSFLLGWGFTGKWQVGVAFVAFWLVWPWYELITRVRKIAMPEEKTLRHKSPPHREAFPGLDDMTDEIEGEEYEHLDDLGREWEGSQQFFRIFHKPDERTQVAICLVEQESFAFYYLRIVSRAIDGTIWTTWNYPFSLNLKLAPEWRMNRESGSMTFLQLLDSHRAFLRKSGVLPQELAASDPEHLAEQLQSEQRSQIAHNVTAGILRKAADGEIRYTWRGLLFIWLQYLRDFVGLR